MRLKTLRVVASLILATLSIGAGLIHAPTAFADTGTFGLSAGNADGTDSSDILFGCRFQNTVATGTLTQLRIYLTGNNGGNLRLGVYSDSTGVAGNLLLDAGTVAAANGWCTISGLNLAVTNNTWYWLVTLAENDNNNYRYQTGGPAGSFNYKTGVSYGALPATFAYRDGDGSTQLVIEATVTYSADTTPPSISNVAEESVADTSATITWDTDEAANSTVYYGTETGVYPSNETDASYVTAHSVELTSLTDETTYFYIVSSADASGNSANSTEGTFATTATPAAGSTVIGTLTLTGLVNNISVISAFSNDDGDNSVVLEYKKHSDSTWVTGIAMSVDRSATHYDDSTGGNIANPWVNTWRAPIFAYQGALLVPNTEYDVRVTYTDSDGVSGTNPVTGTVTTRNDNPASTGDDFYVRKTGNDSTGDGSTGSPWLTIQHAANACGAGDEVIIGPGTYTETVDVTAPGTANNYITFRAEDTGDMPIINGRDGDGDVFIIDGDYVRVSYLSPRQARANVRVNGDYAIVEYCNLQDTGEYGNGFHAAGVAVENGKGALIQYNTITKDTALEEGGEAWGVWLYCDGTSTQGTEHVIRYNNITSTVEYAYRDCISGDSEYGNASMYSGWRSAIAVYGNNMTGWYDDPMEIEGSNVNVIVFDNMMAGSTTDSYTGMASAPVLVGPFYFFRNKSTNYNDDAYKLGEHSTGHIFAYHNTWYSISATAAGPYDAGSYHQSENVHWANNIISVPSGTRFIFEGGDPSPASNDYNLLYKAANWNAWFASTQYSSLANYQSGTGRESHGLSTDPLFQNTSTLDLTLQETSPAHDAGVSLPGFNDSTSPWPYGGLAPDMGAYEYVDAGSPPEPPTDVAATDGASTSQVTITWTKSTGATGYRVYRDSSDVSGLLGDVAAYNDSGAAAGTITAGTATATDGTSSSHVTLTLSGHSTANGATHTYTLTAENVSGASGPSSADNGYRSVGSLTVQWQRSLGDSNASYSNITGGTSIPYNDTGAPSNGNGRYYKAVLAATGAAPQTSATDRGYRIATTTPLSTVTTLDPIVRYENGNSNAYMGGRIGTALSGTGYIDWGVQGGALSHTVNLGSLATAGDFYSTAVSMPDDGGFYQYQFRVVSGNVTHQGAVVTFRAVPAPSSYWGLFLLLAVILTIVFGVGIAGSQRRKG